MTTFELWCPQCRKVTRHTVLPDDRIPLRGGLRAWALTCGCGVFYKCTAGMKYDDTVKSKLIEAREACKMFWTEEELKSCPETMKMTNVEIKDCGDIAPKLNGYVKHITDSTIEETCQRMMSRCNSQNPDNKWCPSAVGDCARAILRDYRSEAKMIERLVRDAIVGYVFAYPKAPNDDCERELKKRAEIGNQWLMCHGFEPESVIFDKEEVPCC